MTDAQAGADVYDRPTEDDLRWQKLAEDLPFSEVDATRRQAEGWRNALIATTVGISALTLLQGRDELAAVERMWRWVIVIELCLSLLILLAALVAAVIASFGVPGERILATGEALRLWSARRAQQAARLTLVAAVLCILGVSAVTMAAATLALAPSAPPPNASYVIVHSRSGASVCGRFVLIEEGRIIISIGQQGQERPSSIPLADLVSVSSVTGC